MDLGIKGKTAIVTAASRGIGYACAETLAQEGANIVICARQEAALTEAADQISRSTGARVIAQRADVTDAQDIDALAARAVKEFGGIDILVAIGGLPPRGSFAETDEARLRQGFEMTVLTVFRLVKAVLPHMRAKKWGRVVAVQSRSVREPIPALTVSNATRPGAAGLIKDLSQTLARDGILLNTVLPGRILTDRFMQGAAHAAPTNPNYLATQTAELPIGRLGSAQEMANAVVFLASERASYINGVALAVDGGLIRSI
jgi:3-oxoacyl-[acyl-carrier protein] reductase